MSLVQCRYNPNHRVRESRLFAHEYNCPNKSNPTVRICPYNIMHKIPDYAFKKHVRNCPDKITINKEDEDNLRRAVGEIDVKTVEDSIVEDRLTHFLPSMLKSEIQSLKPHEKFSCFFDCDKNLEIDDVTQITKSFDNMDFYSEKDNFYSDGVIYDPNNEDSHIYEAAANLMDEFYLRTENWRKMEKLKILLS